VEELMVWDAYEKAGAGGSGVSVGKDEADKKIEEIKDRMRRGDPGADLTQVLNADRRYRYRGVNKKPERIARAQARGFEHIPEGSPERWPVDMGGGGKEMGDQILMREPIEVFKAKDAANKDRQKRQSRQKIDEARENINKMARDAGAVGPHQEAAFETGPEGKEE
jgi:hypothetical protein